MWTSHLGRQHTAIQASCKCKVRQLVFNAGAGCTWRHRAINHPLGHPKTCLGAFCPYHTANPIGLKAVRRLHLLPSAMPRFASAPGENSAVAVCFSLHFFGQPTTHPFPSLSFHFQLQLPQCPHSVAFQTHRYPFVERLVLDRIEEPSLTLIMVVARQVAPYVA